MIKWNIINSLNNKRSKKIIAALSDIKICEACINEYDIFQKYLELLEYGQDFGNLPIQIQNRIINGIDLLNWDGYFD